MELTDKEKLQIELALKFANLLVAKKYKEAHNLLSSSEKLEYSSENFKEEMERMIEYFFRPDKIFVAEDWVWNEPHYSMDDNYIYVPIEEEGNSEAVYLKVDYENDKLVISDIEFGRP